MTFAQGTIYSCLLKIRGAGPLQEVGSSAPDSIKNVLKYEDLQDFFPSRRNVCRKVVTSSPHSSCHLSRGRFRGKT